MLGKVLALSTLVSFVLLSALMQSTSPSAIHPLGILFVFLLLYVLALGVLTFFVFGFARLLSKTMLKPTHQAQIDLKQAYYYASVLALAPVMLIGMKSIGRSSVYEVSLVLVFELIACFYISRRR